MPNKAKAMHHLFIMEKPVILLAPGEGETGGDAGRLTLIKDAPPEETGRLLDALKDNAVQGYLWEDNDTDGLFSRIRNHYEFLQAAGGLVTNPDGDILLMFRHGKWDLPKGKMEAGESPEETALRETTEETGLHHICIEKKLTDTWHAYDKYGKDQLKQTHWFKMRFTGTELTVPQIEEHIVDIQWIRPENICRYLPYAWPSVRAVFAAAGLACE